MQSFTKIALTIIAAAGLASAAPATSAVALEDRATMKGDLTYYAPGLGACGVWSSEDEPVAALSWQLFDKYTPGGNPNNNSLCGKKIKISLNGKSTVVKVVDRCEACKVNDIDVPVKTFAKLANPSIGRIQMSWNWV